MAEKKGLDIEILKEVIQIMKDEDLGEVCIEQNDVKIQVKRMSDLSNIVTQGAAMLTANETITHSSEAENTADKPGVIPAPMVGTFYRSPSPDAEFYVNVGDAVKAGQVICVIDAMKLMNEITADLDGEIVEILVEDGQPVEYGQPIFRIKPK